MKRILLCLSLFFCVLFAQGQIYVEDFEAGLPATWVAENAWMHGTSATLSSAYFNIPEHTSFMAVNDDGPGAGVDTDGRLISGPIDLSGAPEYLFFKAEVFFRNGDYQGADETAKFYISNDGGNTWTEFANLGGSGSWFEFVSNISEYSGDTVQIAIEYNDGDGWNFGLAVDDIRVEEAPRLNVKMEYVELPCPQIMSGTEVELLGFFTNEGAETINTLDVTWSDGTNEYVATYEDLNLRSFQTAGFRHPDKVIIPSGSIAVTSWISNPNGEVDPDDSDNMSTSAAQGISVFEGKGVLVEEATGTWCPWCPRGTVYMDKYTECFPDNFVGVAVHNGDPMVVTAYDNGIGSFPNFPGYPSVIFNRTNILDPEDIGIPTVSALQSAPTANVNVGAEWDDASRQLTVSVSADFIVDMSNVLFQAVLTEDGVTGTTSGNDDWGQTNNYAGGIAGPMSGWEFLPFYVPDFLMVYDHVARALMSGTFNGPVESLIANATAGTTKGYIFNPMSIGFDVNMENTHVVGMLLNATTGQVINVTQVTLDEALTAGLFTSSINENFDNEFADIYPNPVNDRVNIEMNINESSDISVQIVDGLGQLVGQHNFGQRQGYTKLEYDVTHLPNGMYIVHMSIGEKLVSKKITVAH